MRRTLFHCVVLVSCSTGEQLAVAPDPCVADGVCETGCAKGVDPDCVPKSCIDGAGCDLTKTGVPTLDVTGFSSAAGTATTTRFIVRGALLPLDVSTTSRSNHHQIAGGNRRSGN